MSDDPNNLVAAGAILGLLQRSSSGALASLELVVDNGDATNQIDVVLLGLPYLKSTYRITIERTEVTS